MLVFRYISPTWAFATPELENAVAVVEVPVIPVPEYHCALYPVWPLNEIWKVNILWIVILPLSMDTGISTTPPSVTVFAILIVIVGWVGSVSTEVVTPVGATMFELLTEAGTWLPPHMAMTVVVVLPATAAEIPPAKLNESFVSMTE